MNIFLVRHGQSAGNKDKKVHLTTADHALPLTDLGWEQAKRAGIFLHKHFGFGTGEGSPCPNSVRIWTSPYRRARETAEAIRRVFQERDDLNLEVREHINLCEQQYGLFDGLEDEELQDRYPAEWAHYNRCEQHGGKFFARMPLGESRFDLALRVHQAFGTFHRDADKHGVENLIIVCHGTTLRAFAMQWLHYTYEWFEAEPNPSNCAIRYIVDNRDYEYIYAGG